MKTLEQCIRDWIKQVNSSAVGSIAAITPPGNRYEKHTASAAQRTKAAINRLKSRIDKRFRAVEGFPAGKDTIRSKNNEFAPSHIYVWNSKGKKRKARQTTIPVLTSKKSLLDWYMDNSFLDKKGQRKMRARAQAFVSSEGILKSAAAEIKAHAGEFIAGWVKLFEIMGKRINPFTSSKAIGNVKAKGRSSAEIDSGTETLTAYNDAQPDNPSLDSYAQRIIDNDLPKTIDFYKRKQLPFLIRDVKKSLGLTRAQAQNIVVKLKL